MDERATVRLYQAAARGWMVLALLSLALPPDRRVGVWLPLHLALAGGVSVAISGAMGMFSQVLTAAPPHPAWKSALQFLLVNGGVALVAAGFVTRQPGVVAVGGTAFAVSMVLLGAMVARSWLRGLNRRHGVPVFLYLSAIASVITGATIGTLLGSGIVDDAGLYVALRQAHMCLNVLGWASLSIAGTLITLFPSVLKVKMVAWNGRRPARALVGGTFVLAAGLGLRSTPVALVGALGYAGGAIAVWWMLVRTVSGERRFPIPLSGRHMLAAASWWIVGTVAMLVMFVRDGPVLVRSAFLAIFVGGWIVQTLVGAWLYLLPVWRPGHPDERGRWVRIGEAGAWVQLLAINGGLLLFLAGGLAGRGADLGKAGLGLMVAGIAMALFKAYAHPVLARYVGGAHGRGSVPGA